jgi:hypothetical protein
MEDLTSNYHESREEKNHESSSEIAICNKLQHERPFPDEFNGFFVGVGISGPTWQRRFGVGQYSAANASKQKRATPSQAAKSAICNNLKKEEYLRDSMLRVLYFCRASMASASIGTVLAV